MQKQDMIYEDFMEDRAIKMFKDDELLELFRLCSGFYY